MPQEQQKQPPKQRKLTPEEIARFVGGRFTPSQLQLIWLKKMPVNANQDDFELFLYACEAKDLDPLLSEVYCRLQWEKDLGEWKLLILDSIHGMLKSADKTKELNGIETTIEVNDKGEIVSATAIVHRKGCEFPFKATAYWEEYNANTFIWRQKPRVMITKCATALALRLAFASALAGIYVAEEFEKSDNSPAEPDSEFAVGELKSEVETVAEPSVQCLDPDAPPFDPTPDPGFGTHIKEAVAIVKDIIAPKDTPKEKIDASSMPIHEVKQINSALVQRLMLDLEIEKTARQPLLTEFYRGWLNVTEMPKDATVFTPALRALSDFADATRGARVEFVADPKGLGAKLRADKEFENATA